ncbi:baseplate J/gp47 family protein [Clostridium uliginosum]|uniref:Uncharacterized phage protein gp47/JayE n=1 Tax=Clostridium uliginosum TaxID=119641 RepID=A0A1I1KTT7_9CLOT|nr:baseplate J/gp47 family protein [Clostridium uliginosum]SFC63682.1 Uncharacterized phage protein gp47/JayE [Clostridium uliginosum]
MFELKEEELLRDMLNKVTNDLDKRPGSSLIYNALAPAAQEITKLRSDMDRFLEYSFASSNIPSEYLDKRCREHGITRKCATYAIKLGKFYDCESNLLDIPINSRFSIDKINYTAIEKIEKGNYKMQCEVIGSNGNYPIGDLLPIEYIEGLGKGVLGKIIIEGVDVEKNESLFNRLIVKVQTPATSGNKYDYLNWALSVNGVGNALIKPLWNGNGTVRVLITDIEGRSPTEELIKNVVTTIEKNRPIGASVTVIGIKESNINISAKIIVEEGYNIQAIKEKIVININSYFKKIRLKSGVIRFNRIVNCILDVDGIVDYKEISINNEKKDIDLREDNIPILESVVVDSVT